MKIIKWILLMILSLALFSCDDDIPDPDSPPRLKITTLEKVSLIPIRGVAVDLLKCSTWDFEFGCIKYAKVKTLTTNIDGETGYERIDEVEAMQTYHPDYWDKFQKGSNGEILLSPNAWVNIKLEKIGDYIEGTFFLIEAVRDNIYSGYGPVVNYSANLGLPADTTFVIRVEGTEKITIQWKVISPPYEVIKSDFSEPFVLSKFDTLEMKIQY